MSSSVSGCARRPRLGRRHASRQGRSRHSRPQRGHSHLVYWVGTENGRAVAFASGMGFRPTDYRRPMGVVSEEDGEEEIAMVLPLGVRHGPSAAPLTVRDVRRSGR